MNKKIILSLITVFAVAAVVVGLTGAYFSDTETVEGNTISAGNVILGETTNFPFEFDNLAPGDETDYQDSDTYHVQYDGTVENVDLYVAFEYENHTKADLRDIMELRMRGRSTKEGSWGWESETNTDWQDANRFFGNWTKIASGLNPGDKAGFRMGVKVLTGLNVIYNDYQDATLTSNVVFYAVQSGGDAPEFSSVQTLRGDLDPIGRTSITHALDNAQEGDIIKVGPGVYEENLTINTDNVTLYSEALATIKGDTVRVEADNVRIEGFKIDNEGGDRVVRVSGNYSGALIKNNVFVNSFRGIQGDSSGGMNDLEIIGNTFETTYGVAGTENMENLVIRENTFKTTTEGIGLGINMSASGMDIEDNYFYNTIGADGWYIGSYNDLHTKSDMEELIDLNDFEIGWWKVEYKFGFGDGDRAIANK